MNNPNFDNNQGLNAGLNAEPTPSFNSGLDTGLNSEFTPKSSDSEANKNFTQQSKQFTPDYTYQATDAPVKDDKTIEGEKKASTSKTLGIIGLIMDVTGCCGLVGLVLNIISLVMASTSKALLGYEHADAKTGKICSIIGIVVAALSVIVSIVYFILMLIWAEPEFYF